MYAFSDGVEIPVVEQYTFLGVIFDRKLSFLSNSSALDVVSESEDDYFIIFSDSLSVLLSLHNIKVDNPYIPHINYLKAKCHKSLQLLPVVAHTHWGADKSTLLKLYKSLVRSKLIWLFYNNK